MLQRGYRLQKDAHIVFSNVDVCDSRMEVIYALMWISVTEGWTYRLFLFGYKQQYDGHNVCSNVDISHNRICIIYFLSWM